MLPWLFAAPFLLAPRPAYDYAYGYGVQPDCYEANIEAYWYNRPAVVARTECYDAYGNPYIVQGSERLLYYLY